MIIAGENVGNSVAGRQFGVTEGSSWVATTDGSPFFMQRNAKKLSRPQEWDIPETNNNTSTHLAVSVELMQAKARELAREKKDTKLCLQSKQALDPSLHVPCWILLIPANFDFTRAN